MELDLCRLCDVLFDRGGYECVKGFCSVAVKHLVLMSEAWWLDVVFDLCDLP